MKKYIRTGNLVFNEIEFVFVFDTEILKLIPLKKQDKELVERQNIEEIVGRGDINNPFSLNSLYIIGSCNETGYNIIFIFNEGTESSYENNTIVFPVKSYILMKQEDTPFTKLSIRCTKLNSIYPTKEAFEFLSEYDEWIDGVMMIRTENFEKTTTKKQVFFFNEREVKVHFGISRKINNRNVESPIILETSLIFEFASTDDYIFINELVTIARKFIQFLTYEKNTEFTDINLYHKKNGKNTRVASFIEDNDDAQELTQNRKPIRCIEYDQIKSHEGKLFQQIADYTLYNRHIPLTRTIGNNIDEARFVMLTAAFEAAFKDYFGEIEISDEERRITQAVHNSIGELIKKSQGKLKKEYKRLQRLSGGSTLSRKIVYAGEHLNEIIGCFGVRLYKRDASVLEYSIIGDRLAKQRNAFAHGNLEIEFVGESLIDLVFLQYLIYAIQLKNIGLSDENTKKAIRSLFIL
ncbi:hypothetical protein PT179_01445 [Erysipelothrix rhusiopathiae]|nr:hypothetical protein [Erysipelothrix rhusiopathiae]MDE8230118.1 hypothetical protein [Erysipelothrix rhusiopathiae]MDE8303588.1 hypothetical protein [Erysipelothrix rhusiopathiae]